MRLQSHKGNQTTLNKLQTASLLGTLNPEAGDEVREADAGAWSTVARRETDGMSASGSSAMWETMAEGKEIEDECDVWAEMGHWNGLLHEFSWGHRWITRNVSDASTAEISRCRCGTHGIPRKEKRRSSLIRIPSM